MSSNCGMPVRRQGSSHTKPAHCCRITPHASPLHTWQAQSAYAAACLTALPAAPVATPSTAPGQQIHSSGVPRVPDQHHAVSSCRQSLRKYQAQSGCQSLHAQGKSPSLAAAPVRNTQLPPQRSLPWQPTASLTAYTDHSSLLAPQKYRSDPSQGQRSHQSRQSRTAGTAGETGEAGRRGVSKSLAGAAGLCQ